MKTTKHKPKKNAAKTPARGTKATPTAKKPSAKQGTSKKLPAAKEAPKATPSAPPIEVKPQAPAPAPAPTPAPTAPTSAPLFDGDVPGESIPGAHLAKCLRYVLAAVPKEEAEVTFDVDDLGCPTISGHDRRRVHIAYLSEKAACELTGRVPREEAADLADILEGARGPRVRINTSGRVTIAHGVMQPEIVFRFGPKPLLRGVRVPSQEGRTRAAVPLRINTAHLAKAVKWANAVTTEFQANDGIAFLTVTDIETGTMLARAVIAEDGLDIYPEDERQTEIPGSRTAGSKGAVQTAINDMKAAAREGGFGIAVEVGGERMTLVEPPVEKQPELFDTAPAAPREGAVTIEAGGVAVTIEADAKPADPPVEPAQAPPPFEAQAVVPAWPEPGDKPIVVEIPDALFDELSSEAIDTLRLPPGVTSPIFWFNTPDHRASPTLTADSARAVGAECTALGLCCEDVSAGRRHGIEVTVWTVGRAGEKGAAL